MDVSQLIRHQLKKLGLEQKDLALAAEVTESYVSQLLTRKKAPPAPSRTDIYDKIGKILQLPSGELAMLAERQRRDDLRKKAGEDSRPLFQDCRDLLLRKCIAERRPEVERIFAREAFGEMERLVTRTLIEAAQNVAKTELRNEEWLRKISPATGHGYEETRVAALEFLDTDVVDLSAEGLLWFLDPLIAWWDIDLTTFAIEVGLDSALSAKGRVRFTFREEELNLAVNTEEELEPGFVRFCGDTRLSSGATQEELSILRSLRFGPRRPTAMYYYRELQSLRDALHWER